MVALAHEAISSLFPRELANLLILFAAAGAASTNSMAGYQLILFAAAAAERGTPYLTTATSACYSSLGGARHSCG